MSKSKNRFVSKNPKMISMEKNVTQDHQQKINNDDANLPGNAKKQISGIWPLIIFMGLLALIFILGLLTT